MRIRKLERRHLGDGFNPEFPDKDFSVVDDDVQRLYDEQRDRLRDGIEHLAKVQGLFDGLIRVTNGDRGTCSVAIARALACSHRTLQQSAVREVLQGIALWARYCSDEGLYDGRNEAMAGMAGDLERLIEDNPLPYV